MFFSNYKEHPEVHIRKSLLWEYDPESIDWESMRNIVVQRVIERGRREDFYAMLNLYGLEGVRDAIKQLTYLNPKDMAFVCSVFNIKKEELKCYTRQLSFRQLWIS